MNLIAWHIVTVYSDIAGLSFSIADPNDAGQLDVVGFDVNTPSIMNEFAK